MEQYSKKTMEYIKNPQNMGHIENADGIGTVGNPVCGDVMKVYVKIGHRPILTRNKKQETRKDKRDEEYIQDIKVQTLGCGAAIATSSIATEMVKGKSLDEAIKLKNTDVVRELGGLPKVKIHCSLLAEQGIKKAIEDYRKKK